MTISSITEESWKEIADIQQEVYGSRFHEDLQVLKSKWIVSPETCLIYKSDVSVDAYLLAHAWNCDIPPKLFQPLPTDTKGDILFLHDLAVSNRVRGKRVGVLLINHLMGVARVCGYKRVLLVSVQDSVLFWMKSGFNLVARTSVSSEYGEGAKLMQLTL